MKIQVLLIEGLSEIRNLDSAHRHFDFERYSASDTNQAKYLKSEMRDNHLRIERILRIW